MKRSADHSVTPEPESATQQSKHIKLEPSDEFEGWTYSTSSDTLHPSALEVTTTEDECLDQKSIKQETESSGLTDLLNLPYTACSTHEGKHSGEDEPHQTRMPSISMSLDHTTIPLEKKLASDSGAYTAAQSRLLVFDYDGTLTPIVNDAAQALLPDEVHLALRTLASNVRNDVWIVSGRDRKFLSDQFPPGHRIGLYAEHGAFLRQPDKNEWEDLVKMRGHEFPWWLPTHGFFTGLVVAIPHSHIEKKTAALVWHYRLNQEEGAQMAPIAKRILELRSHNRGWGAHVTEGKCVVEIRPNTNNKGHVMKQLLQDSLERHGQLPEFVFCVGDDRTDEGKPYPS